MWKVVDLITQEIVITEDGPAENLTKEEAERIAGAYIRYHRDGLDAEIIEQK